MGPAVEVTLEVNEVVSVELYQGAPGLPGPVGDQGPAGISAYEEAVLLGFVGTEQEWLDSLIGPQGPEGPAGASNLADLSDVDVTDLVNGSLLIFNSGTSKWKSKIGLVDQLIDGGNF